MSCHELSYHIKQWKVGAPYGKSFGSIFTHKSFFVIVAVGRYASIFESSF